MATFADFMKYHKCSLYQLIVRFLGAVVSLFQESEDFPEGDGCVQLIIVL
jgi:hypothetical protein